MRKSTFIVLLAVITLVAFAVALFWAAAPLFTTLAYLYNGTQADLVRQIWYFRLVQPEVVGNPPDYDYLRWCEAETLARLTVVFLGWLAGITFVTRGYTTVIEIAEPLAGRRGSALEP